MALGRLRKKRRRGLKSNGFICFLFGVVITLLVVLINQQAVQPAVAQSGAAGSNNTFGVAGLMSDTTGGVLWVIDPETKQLAAYASDGGRSVRFVGARKIFYDLKLKQINDRTPGKLSVDRLAKEWQKLNKKNK